MATWASRRKFMYGGSVVLALLLIILGIFFSLFYKKPTCFDGIQNGGELGIDCGGGCVKLCQSAYLGPKIAWGGAKVEKVADGLYNAASYIINPNTNAAAVNVPYKIALFDEQGILIMERQGSVTLSAHRNTLVFEPSIATGKRIPVKATFEFLAPPVWFKSHDTLDGLAILDKKYTEDDQTSSLEVTLQNKSLLPYKNITIAAVLFDINGNAIGFSQTKIDEIAPNGGTQLAPFTWPFSRDNKVISIEALPTTIPVRD